MHQLLPEGKKKYLQHNVCDFLDAWSFTQVKRKTNLQLNLQYLIVSHSMYKR